MLRSLFSSRFVLLLVSLACLASVAVGLLSFASVASAASHNATHNLRPALSACQSHPSDANCTGVGPSSSGCVNDQKIIQEAAVITQSQAGYIILYHSATCKTEWASLQASGLDVLVITISRCYVPSTNGGCGGGVDKSFETVVNGISNGGNTVMVYEPSESADAGVLFWGPSFPPSSDGFVDTGFY